MNKLCAALLAATMLAFSSGCCSCGGAGGPEAMATGESGEGLIRIMQLLEGDYEVFFSASPVPDAFVSAGPWSGNEHEQQQVQVWWLPSGAELDEGRDYIRFQKGTVQPTGNCKKVRETLTHIPGDCP